MRQRMLITGGAGFLGSALAERLREWVDLVLLDDLRRNALGLRGLCVGPGIRLEVADVCDRRAVERAVAGCGRVVHLASVAGVDAVESDPGATSRTILAGTRNVLDACRRYGVRRVVIASSSEVYGQVADCPGEEHTAVPPGDRHPRWSYARAKLAAEKMALDFHRRYGLEVTVVRPFNIYGPGQVGQGAVKTMVCRAISGLPLELVNGGDRVRAWCYLDDLLDGLERALFEPAAAGRVYNLGNPECAVTVRELARRVAEAAGLRLAPVVTRRDGPDVLYRVPDISRARRELGFRPRVGLEEGLRRTVVWYRTHWHDPLFARDASCESAGASRAELADRSLPHVAEGS